MQGDYAGALKYLNECDPVSTGAEVISTSLKGFVYLKNGMKKEADWHFDHVIRDNMKINENDQDRNCDAYRGLMTVYSAMGEKRKAMDYLHKTLYCLNQKITIHQIVDLKYNPMFDIIRNEPEFQEFINEMEVNFQAERMKVEKLLREENILVQK